MSTIKNFSSITVVDTTGTQNFVSNQVSTIILKPIDITDYTCKENKYFDFNQWCCCYKKTSCCFNLLSCACVNLLICLLYK